MSGFAGVVAASQVAGGGGGTFLFDPTKKSSNIILSAGDTVATADGASSYMCGLGVDPFTIGVPVYFAMGGSNVAATASLGLGNASTVYTTRLGSNADSFNCYNNTVMEWNGGGVGNIPFSYGPGDTIGIQLVNSTQFQVNKNGGSWSSSITHNVTGTLYPGVTLHTNSSAAGSY